MKFLIPMRGNETKIVIHDLTNLSIFLIPMRGNEIRCGHLEVCGEQFLIPMRGNEIDTLFDEIEKSKFLIPMRGNEVYYLGSGRPMAIRFLIPMRGNEVISAPFCFTPSAYS